MDDGRMRMAMEAADTIVDTLTAADSFAVIAFNTSAYQLGGTDILIEANSVNKDLLKADINQLEADGITNFRAAFTTAFDAIDNTVAVKDLPSGPIAILFMTDGKIEENPHNTTKEEETKEVIDLIKERTKQLSDKGKNVTIFTYSLGGEADRTVTKTIMRHRWDLDSSGRLRKPRGENELVLQIICARKSECSRMGRYLQIHLPRRYGNDCFCAGVRSRCRPAYFLGW
jgi:hypothetical protein